MNNELRLDSGFSIGAVFRAGSFGTYDSLVDARYAKGRVSGSSKFSYLTSQNNFLYRNTYQEGSPYVRQTNAAVNQVSFLQQLNIKLNQRNQLAFYIWLTDANRQLPPVMSQPAGKEQQDDYSLRLMANWKAQYNQLKLRFTSAYIEDKMRYRNPLLALDETSVTHAMRNTLGASYLFPFSLSVNGELNYDLEQAVINAYGCPRMRNAGGVKVYADYYMANGLRFHAGFRQDLVDKKLSAFSPEAAVNYLKQLNNAHQLSAGFVVSRNFRFPTLNDLYWTPGGNPALKEEKSVNGELQFKYGYKKVFSVSVSDFYVYVDNWIQWIPQGSFWMPVNFRRVFSRGAEAAVHLTNADGTHRRRLNVHFNASYTFTKTTNLDAASQFDQSKGMQLIYVPYHSLTAGLQLEFMGLYVRSVNRYTGSVFTSTDNTQSLPGYFVADLEVGKDFSLKDVDFGFSFRVNNIGNAQYQVVLQRPMPGRNFEGTLRFKFYR
jgi:iron complex outermembrane receptor protein